MMLTTTHCTLRAKSATRIIHATPFSYPSYFFSMYPLASGRSCSMSNISKASFVRMLSHLFYVGIFSQDLHGFFSELFAQAACVVDRVFH